MAQPQPSLDALRSLFDAVQRHFAHAVPGLAARTWEQARSAVVARVQEHPRATALQLAMVVPGLVPGLAAGPALLGLGFGGGGIAAGGLAASFQSYWGVNTVFSTLQSAAMSGYGEPIVYGIVQGGAVAAGVVAGWWTGGGAAAATAAA